MKPRQHWNGRLDFVVRFVQMDLNTLDPKGRQQVRKDIAHFLRGDAVSVREFSAMGVPFFPDERIDRVPDEDFVPLQAEVRSFLERHLAHRDDPSQGSIFEGVALPTLKEGQMFPSGGGPRDRSTLLVMADQSRRKADIERAVDADPEKEPRFLALKRAARAWDRQALRDTFMRILLLELTHVSTSKVRRCPARAPRAADPSVTCGQLFVRTRRQEYCSERCEQRERKAVARSAGRRRRRAR